jgi:hypothetical protein
MTDTATTVAAVRGILKDTPHTLTLGAAISDTTDETITFATGQAATLSAGVRLEHDDATGEVRSVLSTDATNEQVEATRAFSDSVASTHLDDTRVLVDPRFRYNEVVKNITHVMETILPNADVYDILEETISSSTNTDFYNAASTACEEHLSVYQYPSSATNAEFIDARRWWAYPENVNTSHYNTGKMFMISGGTGIAGTDPYYVSCRHALTLATLTDEQDLMVQYYAVALLLEQENPRRTGGRAAAGDRQAKSAEFLQSAAYYRREADAIANRTRSRLHQKTKPRRIFVRNR